MLSIIIPSYNAASWLPSTIDHICQALSASPWSDDAEIVVVDDGSTDDTKAVVEALQFTTPLRLVTQKNQGRFGARLAGLRAASGDLVLLIDARVWIDAHALGFVGRQIATSPARVWNADVDVPAQGNPYGRFWRAVTTVAWRRYYRDRRTTSYGADEYDYFPKGTTCFIAPRDVLLKACESFQSHYADLRNANDDTAVIRYIVERERIWISPEFRCVYHSREDLGAFARHTYHRGIVFVDGYFRPGTRYFFPLIAIVTLAPVVVAWTLRHPARSIGALVSGAGLLGIAARALGAERRDAAALAALSPVFLAIYGAGIAKGFLMLLGARLERSCASARSLRRPEI